MHTVRFRGATYPAAVTGKVTVALEWSIWRSPFQGPSARIPDGLSSIEYRNPLPIKLQSCVPGTLCLERSYAKAFCKQHNGPAWNSNSASTTRPNGILRRLLTAPGVAPMPIVKVVAESHGFYMPRNGQFDIDSYDKVWPPFP